MSSAFHLTKQCSLSCILNGGYHQLSMAINNTNQLSKPYRAGACSHPYSFFLNHCFYFSSFWVLGFFLKKKFQLFYHHVSTYTKHSVTEAQKHCLQHFQDVKGLRNVTYAQRWKDTKMGTGDEEAGDQCRVWLERQQSRRITTKKRRKRLKIKEMYK